MSSQSSTIADWTGTNAAPTAFPGAGTSAFGYSTDHALSGGSTRFVSNKWAKFTTSNAEIAVSSAAPQTNDVTKICQQIGVASTQPAGTYTSQMTISLVPSF